MLEVFFVSLVVVVFVVNVFVINVVVVIVVVNVDVVVNVVFLFFVVVVVVGGGGGGGAVVDVDAVVAVAFRVWRFVATAIAAVGVVANIPFQYLGSNWQPSEN